MGWDPGAYTRLPSARALVKVMLDTRLLSLTVALKSFSVDEQAVILILQPSKQTKSHP